MELFRYPETYGKRAPQLVLKEANARRLLRSVLAGQTSRAALAKAHDLSPTTVSALVDELIAGGILTEAGEAALPRAGRRPTMLEVKASGGSVAVVTLRQDGLELRVCDLGQRVLGSAGLPWEEAKNAADALETLLGKVRIRKLRGVCLIPSDRFSLRDGELRCDAPAVRWTSEQLQEAASALRAPVLCGNAATFAAAALASPGKSLLYLRFDESIRAGVVLDGQVWECGGRAPEAAHLCIDPQGPLCACGGHGCLCCYWARSVLLQKAGASDWETFCRAYQEYDPSAREVITDAAGPLALALGNLCCMFPVSTVILDGLDGLGESFLYAVRRQISALGSVRFPGRMELRLAPAGTDLVCAGAVRSFLTEAMQLVD